VTLQWLGHSCFYIHSPGGTAVVLDPFNPAATGLPAPETGAHMVALTSGRPEHGFAQAIRAFEGETKSVVRGAPARRGDLQITPVPIDPGTVAYVVDAAGMRIAHLGGIRKPLLPGQVKAFGTVDILLLPAGEDLKPTDAVAVAEALKPRVVIPMAYSTPDMDGRAARLRPVDDFVAASSYARERKTADVILVSKANLPPATEIWELRYRAR
jgi:L-ascorbate metabolism protein UlaG (beta-lactamase superfamily)